MTAEEIRSIALDSTRKYYDYLDENNKGIQEVEVNEIETINSKDLILKLRLSAKLFDIESVFFKLYTSNSRYDTTQVKVLEYDSDKNILLIKPSEEVKEKFLNLNKHDIKVISDLKFLVKRVGAWYEANGANVRLPVSASSISTSLQKLAYIAGSEPSSIQKESLKSIFTNPFTYVWGAPGTGKTMFVLSYAILHHLNNKKKVAILAPTNNSIEQVLNGVLGMTDKAQIDRKRILRLGTPSKKFAEKYPEVCEERGLQKKLDEFDKQIGILNRIIRYQESVLLKEEIQKKVSSFDSFKYLEQNYESAERRLNQIKVRITEKNNHVNSLRSEQIKETLIKERAAQTINSLQHKIVKFFKTDSTSAESQYEKSLDNLNRIQNKIGIASNEKLALEEKLKPLLQTYDIVNSDIKKAIKIVKEQFIGFDKLKLVCNPLSIKNWKEIKDQLLNFAEDITGEEIEVTLLNEYRLHSLEELKSKLADYSNTRNKLQSQTTQERISAVDVLACTLDGYIGNFTTTKLKVDHIFIDEASYANVIKAMTLFNHSVPITFLGDHKQLPPVCEINDVSIKDNPDYHNIYLWSQSAIFIESLFSTSNEEALNAYLSNQSPKLKKLIMTKLNATFRFGPSLSKILGEYVYDSSFVSANRNGETTIYFANAVKNEELRSRMSINEVIKIESIVNKLKKKQETDYVILTPYKKQVKLLGSHLTHERNELKILTVHGSQGREWDTVILSVVDTSDMWFVDSTRQISKGLNLVNTAVSRAKKNLIIVCDKNYWSSQRGQLITALIKSGTEYSLS